VSTEGMSVLPGLWDMHVHLQIVGHADYGHWDKTYPPLYESVIFPAAAKQLLLAGVTSARDLGGPLEPSISVRWENVTYQQALVALLNQRRHAVEHVAAFAAAHGAGVRRELLGLHAERGAATWTARDQAHRRSPSSSTQRSSRSVVLTSNQRSYARATSST